MRPKTVVFDVAFQRKFEKYKKRLTEAGKIRLKSRLEIFKENVFDDRLKTHKLKGNLGNYYSFSISHSDRIVFKMLDEETVFFIEIGGHDICY